MLRQSIAAAIFSAGLFAPQAGTAAEIVSGNYYENSLAAGGSGCTSQGCTIYIPFGSASAGKTVRITDVDCIVQSNGPVDYAQYFLADNTAGLNSRRFHALDITTTEGPRVVGFHDRVSFKVAGGPPRYFAVEIGGRGSAAWFQIQCGVLGEIE
jgi:hypothetical protein